MRINLCILMALVMVGCATVPTTMYDFEPISDEIWTNSFEEKLENIRFVDSTLLIASTENQLFGINPKDGTTLWKFRYEPNLEDLAEEHRTNAGVELELREVKCDRSISIGSSFKYAFVRRYVREEFRNRNNRLIRNKYNILSLVDLTNGSEIWNTYQLGVYSCVGYFLLPSDQGILLGVEDKTDNVWMIAVDLKTGSLLWDNRDFFKECKPKYDVLWGCQPPLYDTEETMITFMNKKSIRKWDVKTGRMIWETIVDAKESPDLCYGYSPMIPSKNGSDIFVPCDKSILAVDFHDGKLKWDNKPKLE